ncbi:MAG: hypothetical protein IT443_01755 [Phycisphaeraceae bacterium]|nr:hypothetical protein [Phycisphaeraceae bacterium]
MNACSSLPAVHDEAAVGLCRPWMLIDGVPEPRLLIESWERGGRMDIRTVTATLAGEVEPAVLDHWAQGEAVAAWPALLSDQTARWLVLARGRLDRQELEEAAGQQARQVTLAEQWEQLRQAVPQESWWDHYGQLLAQRHQSAVLLAGTSGNRSARRWPVGGREIHVLQRHGQAWTVRTALEYLSAAGGLDLIVNLIPGEIEHAPLLSSVDLDQPIGAGVEAILESYGLRIVRQMDRDGGKFIERRTVKPWRGQRRISLSSAQGGAAHAPVLKVQAHRPPVAAARPWVLLGSPWEVESTFELVPGWDPTLEDPQLPDYTFSRTNNSQFTRYANVYRLWALNEDGAFSAAPYQRGPAFDLGGFFASAWIRPQRLQFGSCLTLDDAGRRMGPIVEYWTDPAFGWRTFPGQVEMRADRAAVYLGDADLPGGFLAYARLGLAKLRITASLTSPQPQQITRWQGNPFLGTQRPQVLHLEKTFKFARVHAQSVHYEPVRSGQMAAAQSDSTVAMQTYLAGAMQRSTQVSASGQGQGKLALAGAWLTLNPGDRIVPGNTWAWGRGEQAPGRSGAWVAKLVCRWPALPLAAGGSPRARAGQVGAQTLVTLDF